MRVRTGCFACAAICACAIAGCGGGTSGGTDTSQVKTSQSTSGAQVLSVRAQGAKPKIEVPPGPPPKKLQVKVLEEGREGPRARWGDRLGVRYVGVNYETKETFEDRWNPARLFSFRFGDGEVRDGWEVGLKGMRLGGRRELTLPSRLAYGNGALVYVVELLEIETPG